MMVRYRTAWFSFVFSFVSLSARAQPVVEVSARSAEAAPDTTEAEEDLTPPELPQPPAALARRVAALTRIVEQTEGCYSYQGERNEHEPDPRCGQWYAALLRGGDAAAYAIGEVLNRPPSAHSVGYVHNNAGSEQRGPRLVQILAATGSSVGPAFLLRYVVDEVDSEAGFDETSMESLRQLARLANYDAHPVAPWEQEAYRTPEVRREAARRWIRWWQRHQGSPVAQWRSEGVERAVADLAHADPAVRFAAIQRLITEPAHRATALEATRALLADDALPARAAAHVVRWARRHRIPIVPRPSSVARVAR